MLLNFTVIFSAIFTCIAGHGASLDRDALMHRAEVDGFGYKFANLEQLSELVDDPESEAPFKFGAYRVLVPLFEGISSQDVQAHLKQYLDVTDAWARLMDQFFATPEQKNEALRRRTFPPDFLKSVEALREIIVKVFPDDFAVNIEVASKFLARHHDKRLMVRSSGKEDTDKLANAGGNESIANVIADPPNVSRAMRDVFISFFGERSLKQRLLAKDETLFDKAPFTPIILQIMIAEANPSEPSKCGVMFTEDAESGISQYKLRNTKGAIRTTGITIIQAAYGHNEAVVNSQIPVDTYYVDDASRIYPTIRYKTYRKVPTKISAELAMVKNPAAIVPRAALNEDAIRTLKGLAVRLEEFYQGPMDVEFVIDEAAKTIYVVQARPIVHSDKLPNPSFIKNVQALSKEGSFYGSSIGVAGGAVRVCSIDESIVEPDISKALAAYQEHKDPERINCTIVGKHAPSTSHEATSFRSDSKPVMYIREWARVKAWLEAGETLVMSPQQHIVAKWGGTKNDLRDTIMEGWVSYPAPLALSLPILKQQDIVSIDKNAILALVPSLATMWDAFTSSAAHYNTKSLFDEVAGEKPERSELALAALLYQIHEVLKTTRAGFKITPQQIIRLYSLESHALNIARAIKDNMTAPPELRARLLLPVHAMKALFYQVQAPYDVVEAESVVNLAQREFLIEQELSSKLHMRAITLKRHDNLLLLKLGSIALTKDLEEQWFNFVVNIDQNEDDLLNESMANLIRDLGKLDLLSPWLHVDFARNQDAEVLIYLFDESKSKLDRIFEYRQMLDALQVAGFGAEKSFLTQWNSLLAMLTDFFLKAPVSDPESWRQASSLERLAMLALMKRLIDKFDLSIKEVKTTKNLERFRDMVRNYITLAETWRNLSTKLYSVRNNEEFLNNEKLSLIRRIADRPNLSEADFAFSRDFNAEQYVNALNPTAKSFPLTLEDAFSVAHQILLASLSGLGVFAELNKIDRPPLLKEIMQKAKFVERQNDLRLIGTELGDGKIEIFYNYPLREHSLQYSYSYDKCEPDSVSLRVQYAGSDERGRWTYLAGFFRDKLSDLLTVKDVVLAPHFLSFTVILSKDTNFDVLNKVFLLAEPYTIKGGISPDLENLAADLFKQNISAAERAIREGTRIKPWQAEKLVSPAIINGDATFLEQLLKLHPEIDLNQHVNPQALSALSQEMPDLSRVVKLLLQYKLRGDKADAQGSPFYLKVFLLGQGQLLIDANVDVNVELNSKGLTLLHWAALHERGDDYLPMLAKSKSLSFTKKVPQLGGQPLEAVCRASKVKFNKLARVQLLNQLGAPLTQACLKNAIRQKNHDIVEFLNENKLID